MIAKQLQVASLISLFPLYKKSTSIGTNCEWISGI